MLDDMSVVKIDISPDCPEVCRDTKLCPGCRLLLLKNDFTHTLMQQLNILRYLRCEVLADAAWREG